MDLGLVGAEQAEQQRIHRDLFYKDNMLFHRFLHILSYLVQDYTRPRVYTNENETDMKWLHNLMKGASLTGALFVFQACYGIPQAPIYQESGMAPMTFTLLSRASGEPLQGIRIFGEAQKNGYSQELGFTDADGRCRVEIPYVRNQEGPFLTFEDPEGQYIVKDTTLADLRDREIIIQLDSVQ